MIGENRKIDTTIQNQTIKTTSTSITKEKQNNRVYVTFAVLTLVVNQIYQSIRKQRSAKSS